MTGFIRGLFNKKDKPVTTNETEGDTYFLDADSAKTFGDIDYMRTPRSVKRSFPTMNGVKGAEYVEVISATEKEVKDVEEETSSPSISPKVESNFEPNRNNVRVDSSMDMFRNMAKDLNKNR
jgi:hypothetical protein